MKTTRAPSPSEESQHASAIHKSRRAADGPAQTAVTQHNLAQRLQGSPRVQAQRSAIAASFGPTAQLRPELPAQGSQLATESPITSDQDKQADSEAIQRMPVAQLATRHVDNVIFRGTTNDLLDLIRQWGPPRGVQTQVRETDHVGHSFRVTFTRNGAISEQEANQWVERARRHFPAESESEDDDRANDEGESEGEGEDSDS